MTMVRMNALDLGAGYDVQFDAGVNADLLVRAAQGGNFLSRLSDEGVRATLAPTYTVGNYSYGGIEQLTGGGWVVYGTIYSGGGRGMMIRMYNASGKPIGTDIKPMTEQGGNELSGTGYTLTATANGGFAVTYTSDASSATQIAVNYTQGGAAQTYNIYQASDVRIRYYDASGNPLAASNIASTDSITINGASTNRQADNQYIHDSGTLAGGQVAYVYLDRVQVGQDGAVGGGFHAQDTLTVQVSGGSGAPGTPVRVDQIPYYTGNGGGDPGVNTLNGTGANVVALPGGGFAVVWTENSFGKPGGGFDGYDAKIRYFDAAGNPTTDALTFLVRGTDIGNVTKYIWAEALPDGRVVVAWQDGADGVNGTAAINAYAGVLSAGGATFVEQQRINPDAATAGHNYSIYDLAVRSDGTFDVAYNDARTNPAYPNFNLNHTVIERFSLGTGVSGETFGGSASADNHTGGAGNDLITGWDGDDTLNGANGNDRIEGGRGDDTLGGGAGADLLAGGEGADTLIGGAGADTLIGGNGSDTASYEGAGTRVVVSLAVRSGKGGEALGDKYAEIENLNGTAYNDILIGDAGANVLTGGAGNDRIDGRGGADTMTGGTGSDIYSVDNTGDKIIESAGAGNDIAYVSVNSYVMDAGLERLVLTGDAYYAVGNDGNNVMRALGSGYHDLRGMGGNDQLYSGSGNDNLYGGTGNDVYYINNASDQAVEYAGEGNDLVNSTVSYELSYKVERLNLAGSAAIDGKGNELANTLTGNSGNNVLEGRQGRDTLRGGGGNDVLSGGKDSDMLIGGAGADAFRFADNSPVDGGRDTLVDFVHGTDRIEIQRYYFGAIQTQSGQLAASEFTLGNAATTTDHHLIYNQTTGTLFYDADGSGAGAKVVIAYLQGNPVLDASDIVLI
ncbi:calcium-binding protein [Novosphingobium sp.]|uniref:calcium-binding protein n=1 Tax=Novosphingobium sp. TaxID=1874826 RepID=UPI0026211E76|nr:calcium-binding protein [Novosphingobium sp.]